MSGWLTVEEADAQIETASLKYVNAENPAIEEYLLQDRFDEQTNNFGGNTDWISGTDPNYSTSLNTESAYNSKGDYIGEVYTTGNLVEPATYTGDSLTGVVINAIDSGDIYSRGGPIPGAGQGYPDQTGMTGYVDSLVLAEASKITGIKWF